MSIIETRENITAKLWKLTDEMLVLRQEEWTNNVVTDLMEFESELVKAIKLKGWDGSDDTNTLQWTFHGSLFYSIIVITTIGTVLVMYVIVV